MNERDCGRRGCHGDSLHSEICKRCIGEAFKKIIRSDNISQKIGDMAEYAYTKLQQLGLDMKLEVVEGKFEEQDSMKWAKCDDDKSKQATLTIHNKHPKVFESYFIDNLKSYITHVGILRRQKSAPRRLKHLCGLNSLLIDIDFAENFNASRMKDEIQSNHWSNTTVTLFICVLNYLCVETWNNLKCQLQDKDDADCIFDDTTQETTYCQIEGTYSEGFEGIVNVIFPYNDLTFAGEDGTPIVFERGSVVKVLRSCLHKKKFITAPVIGVSNDKHSDGAASHFKQKVTLYFAHYLKTTYKITRYTWSFGCPGHGKGEWDGFGGIIKNTTAKKIMDDEIVINNSLDCFELMNKIFNSDEKHAHYDRVDRSVKRFQFYHVDSESVEKLRPSKEKDVDALIVTYDLITGFHGEKGTHRLFFFEFLGDEQGETKDETDVKVRQIAMRSRECWCCPCFVGVRKIPEMAKKNPRSHQRQWLTLYPETIEKCELEESWDYQMTRCQTKPNKYYRRNNDNVNEPNEDNMDIDDIGLQHPEPLEESPDVTLRWKEGGMNWAQCTVCDKWRKTESHIQSGVVFQCDSVLTLNELYRSCEKPNELNYDDDYN